MGQDVEYLVTNFETGEEHFFDDFTEAMQFNPYTEEEEETEQ
jgi:hypothetical protein